MVRIVGIRWTSDKQIPVASVNEYRVKSQKASIAGSPNRPFDQLTTRRIEKPVHDFHLRDESLGINREIGLASVVINRKQARNVGALRPCHADYQQQQNRCAVSNFPLHRRFSFVRGSTAGARNPTAHRRKPVRRGGEHTQKSQVRQSVLSRLPPLRADNRKLTHDPVPPIGFKRGPSSRCSSG